MDVWLSGCVGARQRNVMNIVTVMRPFAQAGAAVAVRVGHFSDPEELPGLAHFLEVRNPRKRPELVWFCVAIT